MRTVTAGRTRAEGEEMSASRPATRRWTSDEERKLDELLDAGKEATEIAVAINRSRQAVYARLQRLHRKRARLSESEEMSGPHPAGRIWARAEDDQFRAMLESGMKAAQIAQKLKRTVAAVYTRK